MTAKPQRRFLAHKKLRFDVGAKVRIKMPGINGSVVVVEEEQGPMGEYWHTISTVHGERREPGCNLELIPRPLSNSPGRPATHSPTIHVHGDNSHINLNSMDNSTNIVSRSSDRLFVELQETARSIEDATIRDDVRTRIKKMEAARESGGFLQAYQGFIASAANHMTLFAPFLPLLTQMLSSHS